MANFDELKQKAKQAADIIADKSVEIYKIAEEKAKVLARITKLSTEIFKNKNEIQKLYTEIGKLYYETHKAEPEANVVQTCMEITTLLEKIDIAQREIEKLKTDNPDIEVEENAPKQESPESDVAEEQ